LIDAKKDLNQIVGNIAALTTGTKIKEGNGRKWPRTPLPSRWDDLEGLREVRRERSSFGQKALGDS
jgi:hypothetical protein